MPDDIQRISARHQLIIDLALEGLSNVDIASKLEISPGHVGQVIMSPIVQHELAERRKFLQKETTDRLANIVVKSKQILEESSLDAATRIRDLMHTSADQKLQFSAAKEILDRVYGKAGEQNSSPTRGTIIINADQLRNLQLAIVEGRDSTPTEVVRVAEGGRELESQLVAQPSLPSPDGNQALLESQAAMSQP